MTDVLKVDAGVYSTLPVAGDALCVAGGLPPALWAVAAHGGAGASTLAAVLAPVGDAGRMWPAGDESALCVVVCRSTVSGLEAAHAAVLQAQSNHAGGCHVLGAVVIADAPGKEPKVIRQKESILASRTTVWKVPYLPEIRQQVLGDLPVWEPDFTTNTDENNERKPRRRRKSLPGSPPAVLCQLGEDLFRAAVAAHDNQEQQEKDKDNDGFE